MAERVAVPRGVLAGVVAGLCGQVATAVVAILPWPVLPLTAALFVVAVWLGLRASEGGALLLRRGATTVALVVALAFLPRVIGVADVQAVKATLGLLLVAIHICQAASWQVPHERRSGLFTALGVLVLAASYSPDILVGLPLLVGWAALLVALAQLQEARLSQVVPAVSVALVLGLVAFLVVPAPVSAGIRSRLAKRSADGPVAQGRGEAGAVAFSGDSLDLRRRGALSTDPVAEVPADSPTLWRAASFGGYDGTGWTRTSGVLTDVQGSTYRLAKPSAQARTDRVRLRTATDGTVWSPGLIDEVGVGNAQRLLDDGLGGLQLPGLTGGYTVTSEPPVTDLARLRSASGTDLPGWRDLPQSLPDRVVGLAQQLTAGTTNRWDAAEAIATWLRAHGTYRLDSPVPAPGEDAVDRFLFVDRTGFCEQYASAEAVLLRAVGIPARLVTGLAYGVPTASGQRLYRVADLHAWVELWVQGTGWVTSDPTAGVQLAASGSVGLRARVAGQLTALLRSAASVPGGRPALALVLLLATALVALLVTRRGGRRSRSAQGRRDSGPLLAAFQRFDARLGTGARRPGESLRDLRSRLEHGSGNVLPGSAPAVDVGPALEVLERECYAPTGPTAVAVAAAVETLNRS